MAIPAGAVVAVVIGAIILLLISALIFGLYFSLPSRRDLDLRKKHALITGGSKGIGKQLARALISRGASVTIVARKESDLKEAATELGELAESRNANQKVQWLACDLAADAQKVAEMVRQAEEKLGPIDVLINNAGHSIQDAIEKLPIDGFEQQMRVNYLSAVWATRAVLPGMQRRKSGHISFVSSAAGQCAIYGYAAYSPTKFALRGFADTLHMELMPYKIGVSILYPPNTNTEGFKVEIETMPEETRLMSEAAGLFSPEQVADRHIDTIQSGHYTTTIGLDGWMLGILTAGAAPERSLPRAVLQFLLAGPFRAVILLYIGYFNGITKRCWRARNQ